MASNHMNEQEREQAKFSLSGATLYGIKPLSALVFFSYLGPFTRALALHPSLLCLEQLF